MMATGGLGDADQRRQNFCQEEYAQQGTIRMKIAKREDFYVCALSDDSM